jgi:hypothetical protein
MKEYIINRYNFLITEKFMIQDAVPPSHKIKQEWEERLENIQTELMALDSLRNEICGLAEIIEHNHHYDIPAILPH